MSQQYGQCSALMPRQTPMGAARLSPLIPLLLNPTEPSPHLLESLNPAWLKKLILRLRFGETVVAQGLTGKTEFNTYSQHLLCRLGWAETPVSYTHLDVYKRQSLLLLFLLQTIFLFIYHWHFLNYFVFIIIYLVFLFLSYHFRIIHFH